MKLPRKKKKTFHKWVKNSTTECATAPQYRNSINKDIRNTTRNQPTEMVCCVKGPLDPNRQERLIDMFKNVPDKEGRLQWKSSFFLDERQTKEYGQYGSIGREYGIKKGLLKDQPNNQGEL